MSGRSSAIVAAVALWVAVSASPLSSQIVTGQVVDSISGTPVGIGFVVLLDNQDREVARTLSESDGLFRLAAQDPGLYRLRSERIGYAATTSSPFLLEEGQISEHTLRVRAQAIVLATVEVQGEDRCHTNPEEAEETGLVWQEIRKALAATAWDSTQELARYKAYGYRRTMDLSGRNIISEESSLTDGYARQPFASISVDALLEEGFIVPRTDETWYNLPDAAVLQDDRFLAAHCFFVVRDSVERSDQIGLAFEPMSERGLPDVRGVLWLDEATSELRVLEVTFTKLPHRVEHDRVGGTIEFLMLPSGAWIVSRWQVRSPVIRVRTGGTRETGDRDVRLGIIGLYYTGGDVLEITTRDRATLYPPGLSHLTGFVYDSSKAGPLAGATISIEDTPFWGSSDGRGAFHLTAPIEGQYTATLTDQWLDSIGVAPPNIDIEFVPGDTVSASFVLPHADSVAQRNCAYESSLNGRATVIGRVRAGSSGQPSSGTSISAHWQSLQTDSDRWVPRESQRTVRTDGSGSYVLCDLPVGVPLTIDVDGARPANIVFPRHVGGHLLLARAREPGEPYTRNFRTSHRTWKVDLLLTGSSVSQRSAETRHVLSGYVTENLTGRPLSGVTILLNNADSAVTRIDGTFDLIDAAWVSGNNIVAASRNGFQIWTQEIWLTGDETRVELTVQLQQL
jgi:hypothetical protein